MPFTITVTGDNAVIAAAELRNFYTFMQAGNGVPLPGNQNLTTDAAALPKAANNDAEAAPAAEKKGRGKAKEDAAKPDPAASKYTLQNCIDKAKEVTDNGKDEAALTTLAKVIEANGIDKVRNLPPEKLDGFMADLEKAFPPKAKESMFD